MKSILSIMLLSASPLLLQAQKTAADVPEVINAEIPGAVKLGKPILIMGGKQPVMAKGHGIAAPAFYDVDGDGNKDLLIGEFVSGIENGTFVGNFLRKYKNTGDNTKPVFSQKFDYVRSDYKLPSNGTPLSTVQGCCIGFTPQFIDLDQDGVTDLVSGQYDGDATWFRGTKNGFDAGCLLDQEGDPRIVNYKVNSATDTLSQFYWLYSAMSFADLDGDGLTDIIVGGDALRFSKNIGTKANPRFALRELLLDMNDKPLEIDPPTAEFKGMYTSSFKGYYPQSGTGMVSPYVTDWDHDGVPDILATAPYMYKNEKAVTFFKGRKTGKGIRFEPGIALFRGKNGAKEFPGRWLHISVADWNNDGVEDLFVGTSVVTIHDDVFQPYLSWNWERETGVQKYDPGNMKDNPANQQDYVDTYLKKDKPNVKKIPASDYVTARHRGYVYVMLGEKK